MQNEKKNSFEGFGSFWNWSYNRLTMILVNNFLEERNLNKNRGSLVEQFYKKD